MEIVMVEELDDVTPEEIGEELSDSPFEPRWVMYMYEHRRPDGRVSYPLCLIYYNPAGCPVDLNMCERRRLFVPWSFLSVTEKTRRARKNASCT